MYVSNDVSFLYVSKYASNYMSFMLLFISFWGPYDILRHLIRHLTTVSGERNETDSATPTAVEESKAVVRCLGFSMHIAVVSLSETLGTKNLTIAHRCPPKELPNSCGGSELHKRALRGPNFS